jgi:CBS domain-containing protein
MQSKQTLLDAAKEMAAHDIGAVPVFEGERAAGILTDRDIVVRGLALGLDLATDTLDAAMSPSIVSVDENSSLEDAVKTMEEKQVRRLLVRDQSGRVTGIVSLADIAMRSDRQTAGEVLQKVSEETKAEAAGPVRR